MAGPDANARAGRSAIYSVELEVFEGPLDLLLHLVRRHELEILDIPIAFITEKYLEYLDFMRSLDLEVAGDYLVMAATLAWLKSRELLPTDPLPTEAGDGDDEDGEDPREALIRRLVEYERFKNAAADLDSLPVSGRDVFARGADIDIPPVDPGLAPVTLFRLAEAYYKVLTRAKINKSHEVQLEPVTVAQRMTQLTLLLDQKQAFDFEGLFLGRTWSSERELRGMLVVTLMSVLELVKLGVAGVQQVPETDMIRIYRLDASDEARALIDAYDEEASFGDAGRPPPAPPPPTEAELDAAEESVLLAEALAGADDTDLGPDAGTSPAANAPLAPDEIDALEAPDTGPETDADEVEAEPETDVDEIEAEPETTDAEVEAEPATAVDEVEVAEPATAVDETESAAEADAIEAESAAEADAIEAESATAADEVAESAGETAEAEAESEFESEADAIESESATAADEVEVAELATAADESETDEIEAAESATETAEVESESETDEIEAAESATETAEVESESETDKIEAAESATETAESESESETDEIEATESATETAESESENATADVAAESAPEAEEAGSEPETNVLEAAASDPIERGERDVAGRDALEPLDARDTTESGRDSAEPAAHAPPDEPGTADPGQEDEA